MLKILLLQAREVGDPVRQEERQSFADKAGLELEQIETHDLLTGPPERHALEKYDALMVGGSGDFYISNRSLPKLGPSMEFLSEVADRGFPMFASCFGFQLLVQALGGEIVYGAETTEVGTFEIRLTEEGREDELTGVLPEVFAAQLGHKDRAEVLPPDVVHLASSELNRYQAFRLPGRPIWATQFHPELDGKTNRMRFDRYLDGYAAVMTEQEQQRTAERFFESPETSALLPRFLELVFGE
ncbi:MAG: type 1 glutamine amidotransferase [Acidobacteriota bacterium]